MSRTALLTRLRPDPYMAAMLGTVLLAVLLPAQGAVAAASGTLTEVAIALLFFLYGARLSPRATWDGLRHWRLHLAVFATTFVVFPLLGLALSVLVPVVLPQALYLGLLYVCTLPSTVQSSIAFTSTARGNVAAAICSASLSSLLGIVLTPLLVAALFGRTGAGVSPDAVVHIVVQLLVPFVLGQLLRRWIGGLMQRHSAVLSLYDRGSILLIVYTAFSEGVTGGIWQRVAPAQLAALLAVEAALLAAALLTTRLISRQLGFAHADRATVVFCGSKKSMATGLPMANILFAGREAGLIVLPLMLFHQMQLIVCAAMAQRMAARADEHTASASSAPPASAPEPAPSGGTRALEPSSVGSADNS